MALNGPFISQFDTSKQRWINITSVNREDISCTNFNNGLVAIFSGMSRSLSNAANAPLFRFGYCAITLPDENILYIGGASFVNSSFMPIDNETSNGRVIIFGGFNGNTTLGDLWILNITMFQWSIGKILNSIVDLILYGHTATLVDNYMFVAF
ncbi:3200_t:CDS:2, partial [Gigaspora margarita]